jgi:hypothetical protein
MGVFRQSPNSFHSRQQLDHVAGRMVSPFRDGKFEHLPRLDQLGSRGEGSGHNLTVDQDDVFPAPVCFIWRRRFMPKIPILTLCGRCNPLIPVFRAG